MRFLMSSFVWNLEIRIFSFIQIIIFFFKMHQFIIFHGRLCLFVFVLFFFCNLTSSDFFLFYRHQVQQYPGFRFTFPSAPTISTTLQLLQLK